MNLFLMCIALAGIDLSPLKDDVDIAKSGVASATQLLRSAELNVLHEQDVLQDAEKDLCEVNTRLKPNPADPTLLQDLQKITVRLCTAREDLKKAESDRDLVRNELASSERNLVRARAALASATLANKQQQDVKGLKREVKILTSEVSDLRKAVAGKADKADVTQLATALNTMTANVAALHATSQSHGSRLSSVESSNAVQDQRLAANESAIYALQRRLDIVIDDMSDLRVETLEQAKSLANLRMHVTRLRNDSNVSDGKLRAAISMLQNRIADARAQCHSSCCYRVIDYCQPVLHCN